MYRVAVIIGERPATVWSDYDFDDLPGLQDAWRALHFGAPERRVEALTDYDRFLIEEAKASLPKSAPATT